MSDAARVPAADVRSAGRTTVNVDGRRVVVFPFGDSFVAYQDFCPHQGGPVCSQGTFHPYLDARILDDGRVEDYFREGGETVVACPWHGWEYELETGRCLADATKGLRAASVTVDGDDLLVSL